MINVKDTQFGAMGNGQVDDTAAIQRAVNYARGLTYPTGGGNYKASIFFPAGFYYITAPIDITNTNGIWLMGDGGSYLNTSIIGVTGGIMFDFSGSSVAGCENFSFISNPGNGSGRSTIGVQFALTSHGGLNCGIRNCYFQLQDFPTANNGLGTIGVLNVRSEEFYIDSCLIRANTPIIMSYNANVVSVTTNYTVTSPYQTLASGAGSMGSVDVSSTSLQNYEKRQPALVLNGTNSFSFRGYIGRFTGTTGTNETAIFCNAYTTNLYIYATIEAFSRVLHVTNSGFDGNELNIVSSSVSSPTTELIDITGCTVKNLKVRITLPILAERSNRYVLYHSSYSDPNQVAAGSILNSEITCFDISTNQYIISPSLLKKTTNVIFNTSRPFEKRGGRIKQLSHNYISAGNAGSVLPASVFSFLQADNTASPNGRGGYYRVWVDGVIQAGGYGSGGSAVLTFQAQILINQNNTGKMDPPSATVIILDKSVTNPTYLDVVGVLADISFTNRIGTVTITPRITGVGTTEPVTYNGVAELQSDFLIYDAIPL
ncbi:glycosyl hydrolase family 28-related protein [Spirosoma sp.]|uniref:glycosyl hydrolase family 28-related protein n=1 Tax=Spirosoma sp. TaxID=1899569 RepID=UPI003B3B7FFE